MLTPARDKLVKLLAGTAPVRAHSAMLHLPGDALTLEIAGVGAIPTPIRAAQAKKIISAARPAKFGRGEATVSDTSVRDTWELTPDQVQVDGPIWSAYIEGALEHFRDKLGLPAGSRLTAELHSFLVYGQGQFFLPHQDSEKHERMVATLVVMLPSVHTGGELVVDDSGTELTYRGSRDDLVLVVFYADRRHEVRPVRSGYRVSMTFNVLLASDGETTAPNRVAEVASCLTEHFTTRVISKYGNRDLGEPERLAFLLDHEYTQGGIQAGRFKGADADRVATLRAAAERAGCEVVFGLTEIRETWDVLAPEDQWTGRDYYDDGYWEGDEDEDEDVYRLNELIDNEISLGWWINPDRPPWEKVSLHLTEDEVCTVTPTQTLTPYESEYEGYMGNDGNTLDRWYRRAAVIMWPTAKDLQIRAQAGSAWVLESLLGRVDAGDLDGARADAIVLEPFWADVKPAMLVPALRLAVRLEDAAAARVVASPFRLEILTSDHATLLAELLRAYGEEWIFDLLNSWSATHRSGGPHRLTWATEALVPLSKALGDCGAEAIAARCVELTWRWILQDRIRDSVQSEHPGRRRAQSAALAEPVARVIEAAPEALAATISEELRALDDHVVEFIIQVLRVLRGSPTPAALALVRVCRGSLTRTLAAPARSDDDWSINWSGCGCGCELCAQLGEFLADSGARNKEWPIAKAKRQHVHWQIDSADLPVTHTTRRTGSPYQLVLTKSDELFRRESAHRQQARADVEWLASAFG